ncbi:MAG TPA: LuxR C-terminal-related transcriptional regulator [Thermomicrobiales bacterium]|nr:LuxR C-terminal-related transcriptional regulator [Thermomicrobiales bacterium]
MIINDVSQVDDFQDIPAVTVFGMRAYIGVPIVLADGGIYGTLCALDRTPQQKTRRDLDMLLILARLLASQLDRQQIGALEERQRIAREIHDTLAQSLASLTLDLSLHTAQLGQVAPHLVAESQRMLDATRDALREVRRSIWNLQPGALQGKSLTEAIGIELRETLRAGIDASIELRGPSGPLPPPIEATVMRIAQEALANVRKHSRASQVIVTLEYLPDALCLHVDDDGRGIDLAGLAPTSEAGGFGLASMRERARQAGGDLRISLRPGGGTSLFCRIPRLVAAPAIETAPTTLQPPDPTRRQVRVGIIDDHAVVREGLIRLLGSASGITVSWQAPNAETGLELIARAAPEVLLLDLQMPGLGGLGCLERLASTRSPVRTIVLTTFALDEMVFQAIRLGARGYLLKDASPDDLIDAVRTVAGGGTLLAPVAAEQLAQRVNHPETLTPREREVLALLADGLRNKEIALQLGTSEKTVQFHIANLFGKLGVSSRTEAARVALERGLLASRIA